jgi:hypothetical protein
MEAGESPPSFVLRPPASELAGAGEEAAVAPQETETPAPPGAKPAKPQKKEAGSQQAEAGESPPPSVLRPPASESAVAGEDDDLARLQKLWPAIVLATARANNSTGAFLAEAMPISINQNKLLLSFGAQYALFMNTICKQGPARKLVEQQIAALFGRNLSLEGTLAKATTLTELPELDQGSLF